jgi:hypothetical protein
MRAYLQADCLIAPGALRRKSREDDTPVGGGHDERDTAHKRCATAN